MKKLMFLFLIGLCFVSVAAAQTMVYWTVYEYPFQNRTYWAITETGDVYFRSGALTADPPNHSGNFWSPGPDLSGQVWDWTLIPINNTNMEFYVILENGDVYKRAAHIGGGVFDLSTPDYKGNFWGSAPVPSVPTSFGKLKGDFNK